MSRKLFSVTLVLIWGAALWLPSHRPVAAAEPCALCGGKCPPDVAVTVTDWQTNERHEYDCLQCAVRAMAERLPWSRVSMKSPLTGSAIKLTRTQTRWTASPAEAIVVAPAGASGDCIAYRAFSGVEDFKKWAKRHAKVVPPSAEPIRLSELPARYAAHVAAAAAEGVTVAPTLHDVPEGHWAQDAVMNSVANELMGGYPDGSFRGENSLTRYEMAVIAQRILRKLAELSAPDDGGAGQSEPVAAGLVKQLADELHAAGADQGEVRAALNLLSNAVTEGARVAMAEAKTTDFADVPTGHWAAGAVKAVAAAGLMDGYPDGTFRGDQPLRRYEIAVILQRLLTKMAAERAAPGTAPLPEVTPAAEAPPIAEAVPPAAAAATEESLAAAEQRLAELRKELAGAGLTRAQIDAALRRAEDVVAAKRQQLEEQARAERVGALLANLEENMRAAGIGEGAVAGAVESASQAIAEPLPPGKARPAKKRQRPQRPPAEKTGTVPNFFGQGGVILTPNAGIIEERTGHLGAGRITDSNLFFGTYGLTDKLEVTTTATGGELPSRLLFSGKYRLLKSEKHDWSVSVGALDALDELDTTLYGVWTKDLSTGLFSDEQRRLSLSAGVGAGDLLDGLFGGVELELGHDLTFLGELVDFGGDDDVNVGLRYQPRPWWHVKGVFADDEFGAGLSWGREF